jgi:hypothetical protein
LGFSKFRSGWWLKKRPVRLFSVHEDDAGVLVLLVGVAPHVEITERPVRVPAGFLEPGVLVRGVVQGQVDDDPHTPCVRFGHEPLEIADGAELIQHGVVVRDVVAAVTQRRLEERRKPEAVHPQPLQVIKPVNEPREVPGTVTVGIRKGSNKYLVEHRFAIPQWVMLETGGIQLKRALGGEVLAGALRIEIH